MPYPSAEWRKKYGDYQAKTELSDNHNSTVEVLANKEFQRGCDIAKVKPTKSQARKFKNKKGTAFHALDIERRLEKNREGAETAAA